MTGDSTKINLTCPKCGSTDIAGINGDDATVVICQGCGKEFGSAVEVRAKVMNVAKEQAMALAKKTLGATVKKLNKKR